MKHIRFCHILYINAHFKMRIVLQIRYVNVTKGDFCLLSVIYLDTALKIILFITLFSTIITMIVK